MLAKRTRVIRPSKRKNKEGGGRNLLLFTPLLLLSVCVLMNLRNTSIADVPEMSKEKVDERMRLVESVIATRVFETHVSNIPVLQPLFKEYERAQKYFIKDLRMGEFDRSCDRYWQDSLSVSGDFDKDFYERKEMFKIDRQNPPACSKRGFGCCTTQNEEEFCLCRYDGPRDIEEEVLRKVVRGESRMTTTLNKRGFSLTRSKLAERLSRRYHSAMKQLGYQGGWKGSRRMAVVKSFSYLPPQGFHMWHTNRHDNNNVPYRLYIISVDKDGESGFKYLLPDGKVIDVPDFHGSVRLFSNTHEDAETGEKGHLWHTVYSKSAHRHSIGFEIPPEQIVALLDSCDGCWDDLLSLRSSL